MRICFVSHSAGLGGAERSLLELVKMLASMNIQCSVILPYKGALSRELTNLGIDVVTVPFAWWMGSNSSITSHTIRGLFVRSSVASRAIRSFLNLLTFPILVSHIKLRQCDVVYTNTMTVCVGAFAAWLIRRPHVWDIREFGAEDFGLVFDLGEQMSLNLMNRLSSAIVVNSQAVASKFIPRFGSKKVRLIYPCVVAQSQESNGKMLPALTKGAGIRCVIVGSLQKAKGQEDAVLAAAELRRLGIDVTLWIVGPTLDRNYEKHLRRLVVDLQLDNIKFLGPMENTLSVVSQADIVLMCSRSEAFGRVTLEGMLAGKPVIGTRAGGTLELIREGFNGLLYIPGDYHDLARKIIYLHENPSEARRMGRDGEAWARANFSRARYAKEVVSVLRQVTEHRSD